MEETLRQRLEHHLFKLKKSIERKKNDLDEALKSENFSRAAKIGSEILVLNDEVYALMNILYD